MAYKLAGLRRSILLLAVNNRMNSSHKGVVDTALYQRRVELAALSRQLRESGTEWRVETVANECGQIKRP